MHTNESAWITSILTLTNKARADNGLPPVSLGSPAAQTAARIRSEEIVAKFDHVRPDGRSCFTALSDQGVGFTAAGENIAAGYSTPESIFAGWMASPDHRDNILRTGWTNMAVGYARSDSSEYIHYGVQLFYTSTP
ncbi:MAG TPA: CAP domain-containing protein [Clostridia bacterium]